MPSSRMPQIHLPYPFMHSLCSREWTLLSEARPPHTKSKLSFSFLENLWPAAVAATVTDCSCGSSSLAVICTRTFWGIFALDRVMHVGRFLKTSKRRVLLPALILLSASLLEKWPSRVCYVRKLSCACLLTQKFLFLGTKSQIHYMQVQIYCFCQVLLFK